MSDLPFSVTIVISFANDAEHLKILLPKLLDMPNKYPVHLADVGKDKEALFLAQKFVESYPDALLLPDMTGRIKAMNALIDSANTDFVLFLDPSAQPINDSWIEILAHQLYSDDTIETITPLQINEKEQACYTGVLLSRCNPVDADRIMPMTHERVAKEHDFKMLNGSVLMIRKTDRRFDQRFKLSFEDIDFTLNVYLDGKRNVYQPKAKVQLNRQYARSNLITPDDAQTFIIKNGGLEKLDGLNDAGEYYESGKSFSAIENYRHKQGGKKFIACFPADFDGCGLHRVINPYRSAMMLGYDVLFTAWIIPDIVKEADVLVWQRAASEHILESTIRARQAGKKVIYEIDDYFHGLHPGNPSAPFFKAEPEQLRRIEQIIYFSSALTVTTPELAKQYGRFNSNIRIMKNHVDFGLLPWHEVNGEMQPDIKLNETDTVRIGWGGSNTHDADLESCAEAVQQIMLENPNTVLVFMGWDYRHMFPKVPIERMEWLASTYGHEDCVGDYYKELNNARLDIGIAPIEDTKFNQAKSDIKVLEYSIFGIASVASDVAPYAEFEQLCRDPQSGERGILLASTPRDWYKHLKRLVESKELRDNLGRRAQQYVWNNRSIQKHGEQIDALINDLYAGQENVPNKLPRTYEELLASPKEIENILVDTPTHSLNISYNNHLTSKQATKMKKLYMEHKKKQESRDPNLIPKARLMKAN